MGCMHPTGHLAYNPAMCPDWDLNWRPFSSQASAQPTEPHQPEQFFYILINKVRVVELRKKKMDVH